VGEPDRAPDLRDLYDSLSWHARAACRGEEKVFLSDRTLGRPENLGSATVVQALLMCSSCPVRRECLREGLREVHVELDPLARGSSRPTVTAAVDGIWGGTLWSERVAVRHLPPEAAIAKLERTFPRRLRRQVAAFRRRTAALGHRLVARDRLILKMLEDRRAAVSRHCQRCGNALPTLARSDARYCSVRCRVAAWRARGRVAAAG
jgi:hypothetical protein